MPSPKRHLDTAKPRRSRRRDLEVGDIRGTSIYYNRFNGPSIGEPTISGVNIKQARQRHRNIAKHIITETAPTIPNLWKAADHYLQSIGVNKLDEDPTITGTAPTPGFLKNPKQITTLANAKNRVNRMVDIISKKRNAVPDNMWDNAYFAAYRVGDESALQRLRDLHFMSKAPNTKIVNADGTPKRMYHQTFKLFNKFAKPGRHSSGDVLSPYGVFTKQSEKDIGLGNYNIPMYVNTSRPLRVKDKRELYNMLPIEHRREIDDFINVKTGAYDVGMSTEDLYDWARKLKLKLGNFLSNKRYNGLQIENDYSGTGLVYNPRNTDATIVPYPSLVKSSKAVTYDNKGNIIPLSKRDNFRINDLRYSLAVPIILGAALGTMPKQQYKAGGTIHINPANRGKFTATMKRTGKTAEELSHSSNPLTRKRAIFALNARKWNH